MKICCRCKIEQPLSEFHSSRKTKDGLNRQCKSCVRYYSTITNARRDRVKMAELAREWRKKNPEKARLAYMRMRFKRFGITFEDYDRMYLAQQGRCAICGKEERAQTTRGETKTLAIDHDAETGRVRGLLCARCNTGIGSLQHDVEILTAAIEYLRVAEEAAS